MISRYASLPNLVGNQHSAFLLGPRGVGKTSLLRAFCGDAERSGRRVLFLDLLNLRTLSRYTNDPGLFRDDITFALGESDSVLVCVDEVQKAPFLLDEVHYALERFVVRGDSDSKESGVAERRRVQFILSGSSARKLRRSGANLLAGRALSCALHPLSELDTPLHLERALQWGTLPRYYLGDGGDDVVTAGLLDGYVATYLSEEVLAERLVRRLEPFHRFLALAAQMNGQLINFSSIAREIRISDQSVRDYYTILTDTLLAFELPAWSRSIRRQLSLSPRFYFFDCGVMNALLGEQSVAPVAGTGRFGCLFEAFVVAEFFRQKDYLSIRRSLFSWRTQRGESEVDIVIDRGLHAPPIGIEIKSADRILPEDIAHMAALAAEFPDAPLYCICRTERPYRIELEEKALKSIDVKKPPVVDVLPWESGITQVLLSAKSA
jgi:predicted AAA+ superfamily ATPase